MPAIAPLFSFRFFAHAMNALMPHLFLVGLVGRNAQTAAQLFAQTARRSALALFALAALGASNAFAAGLQVAPVSVALAQAERAAVLTISNTGTSPMNVQVRAYKWSQTETDEYVLDATNDLIVSPPIMQLAPGAQQELRLIRTQPSSAQEQQYRIIVDELPSPTVALKKGINLMLRHNIPVFLNAEQNPSAQLQWRGEAVAGGKTRIRITNTGQTRAQIARIWLAQQDKEITVLSGGLTGYVLPGQTLVREYPLPLAEIQAATTQLKAQVNASEITVQLGQ